MTAQDKWPWQVLLIFNGDDFKETGSWCGGICRNIDGLILTFCSLAILIGVNARKMK